MSQKPAHFHISIYSVYSSLALSVHLRVREREREKSGSEEGERESERGKENGSEGGREREEWMGPCRTFLPPALCMGAQTCHSPDTNTHLTLLQSHSLPHHHTSLSPFFISFPFFLFYSVSAWSSIHHLWDELEWCLWSKTNHSQSVPDLTSALLSKSNPTRCVQTVFWFSAFLYMSRVLSY